MQTGAGGRKGSEFLWGRQYSIYNYIGLLLTSEQRANDRTQDLESGGKARPIAGRPDPEVALRGSEDKEVERDFEGYGEELRHRGAQRQAVPRALPQPPQGRNQEGKVDCGGGEGAGGPARPPRQPLGTHLEAHPRQVPLPPLRTENCVKNMLYSKLRKAIRQLNRFSY